LISIKEFPNQFKARESVDVVVTEYGIARLKGFTLRERAQALIDIAHPTDRPLLIEQAKAANIIYPDQIFLADSAHLYPAAVDEISRLKDGTAVRYRPMKPSDEEQMRQLFYRFSDEAVYYRYFGHVKAMPHAKMQQYVNVDWSNTMSIVGLVESGDKSRVIAEARYIIERERPYAEVVFVVDEAYQGQGIATYMLRMLVRLARERGVQGFTADVLFSNLGMMKVFRNGGLPIKAELNQGIYHIFVPFYDNRT
jgi:GNAT superfamily N-acetyltransferase